MMARILFRKTKNKIWVYWCIIYISCQFISESTQDTPHILKHHNKSLKSSYERTDITNSFRSNVSLENGAFPTNNLQFTIYYDTKNQDDMVKQQYSSLPYPPVSKYDMEHEKDHYDDIDGSAPYKVYYALTPRMVNHFLFKGKNAFR